MSNCCQHILSVVIIGRNDATALARCLRSVRRNLPLDRSRYEVIYVDSDSFDDSIQVAEASADVVVKLTGASVLSASAGRYHGVRAAHARWILHLDSDMTLASEFGAFTANLVADNPCLDEGFVGYMPEVLNDSVTSVNSKHYRNGLRYVRNIGGAVLLPKAMLEAVGNWSDRIFANEEIDLMVRIRASGGRVSLVNIPIATHYAGNKAPFREKMLGVFALRPDVPRTWGFGQMVRLRWRTGEVGSVVRFFPEPPLAWGGSALLLAGLVGRRKSFAILGLIAILTVARLRNWRFVIVANGLLVHLLRGWTKLPPLGPACSYVARLNYCPGVTACSQ